MRDSRKENEEGLLPVPALDVAWFVRPDSESADPHMGMVHRTAYGALWYGGMGKISRANNRSPFRFIKREEEVNT